MAYQISSFRRFPAAFAIVAASALAFTGLIATATPAYAQSGSDYRCAGLAEQAHVAHFRQYIVGDATKFFELVFGWD